MRLMLASLSAVLLLSQAALAHPGHDAAAPMPKEFDQLKQLVGTWEGKADMGDKQEHPVTVVYELTSGGTAIAEKTMPGTPHEMITIYYKDGKSLAMTHYCAMGNHPQMKLKKADDKAMSFEMVGVSGISSPKESHMHALTLTMADADSLRQEWVNFENGKKSMTAVFDLKRKK